MSKGERLCALLREQGYTPRAYSGRGMMGRQCVGVEVWRALDAAWMIALSLDPTPENAAFRLPRWDSMGRDEILYWPSVEWPADET